MARDIFVAIRSLRRRGAFSIAWIANYAIGICGFIVVYSVVEKTLLRPLPYPEADRLIAAFQVIPDLREQSPSQWNSFLFSHQAFRALQHDAPSLELVAAFGGGSKVLGGIGSEPPERVDILRVSANAFRLLGVHPAKGRVFVSGEDAVPGTPIALISHDMWRSRFGSRDDVLGRSINLSGVPHEVVGVLPEGFRLPRSRTPAIWVPLGADPDDALPGKTPLSIVARLRDGVDAPVARDQIARVLQSLAPGQRREARVAPWQVEATKRVRRPLLFLLGASGVLLVLASISVGGLFGIELRSRWRELATRSALGARRSRILRELSFEGVGLAIASLLAGTWLAMLSLAALRAIGVQAVPQLADARIDFRVIVVASAVAITTSIVIAMLSGWAATQRAPAGYLTTTGASQRRTTEGTFTARLIVGVQFSLASFLVIGALLLSVNLRRVSSVDAGFDPAGRLVATMDIGGDANDPVTAIPAFTNIADRVRRLPGVRDVAIASAIPFSGGNSNGAMTVEHSGGADTISARFSSVLPGFLELLGLRLIAGRSIDDSDRIGAEPVAVVNETTAKRFLPLGSLGGHVVVGETRFTIVGVVSDVHHTSLVDSTMATAYFAERQKHSRFLQLLIRTTCATASSRRCSDLVSLSTLRAAVAEVEPGAVVVAMESMPTLVHRTFAGDRFRAAMIGMFAAVAILITVFGAYTTTARAIQLARAEIAIRLALGATNAATIRRFSSDIAIVAAAGTMVGSLGAMYAGKFVSPFLPLTSASEPAVYLTVLLGLPAIALVTAVLASGAITRISPCSILKSA